MIQGLWELRKKKKKALCLVSSSFDFTKKAALHTFLLVATLLKGPFMN